MKGRNLDYGHMYEGHMVRTELDNIERNAKREMPNICMIFYMMEMIYLNGLIKRYF
jgi:hypothetical protein